MLTSLDLGILVGGFSVSHIGLSAVREPLIERCGAAAGALGLVGRGWQLPEIWLADTGGLEIWPDEGIAGRQLYRLGYTAVASALLFPALAAYPAARLADGSGPVTLSTLAWWASFAAAAAAQGVSIASLFNPSPLSLVPAFDTDDDSPLGVRRDDTRKLAAAGLTRITRHPLILPVVPWGVANALLTGGHACDLAIFVGLSLYALAGCRAQDVRVAQQAQVGTVFEDGALNRFYQDTSFLPFGAVLDGRQSLDAALREVPAAAVAAGLVLGGAVEWTTLQWIGVGPP